MDVAEFVKASGYTGVVEYGFTGAGEASSVSWTSSDGKGKNDVLMGKSQSEFDHPISSHTFTITYHVQRINLIFVMLIGALAIVGCGAVIMFFSWLVLRRRRKRQEEKMEAVMTMALVKLPDGTQTMMEVTPEEAANAVVIAPKDDDGLDEDDDEPENMWLFTTAMRLFAAMAGVLVALNYAGVDSERNQLNPLEFFNSAKGVSGWDLIVGKEINDRLLEGSYFNVVLIVIPLVIFLLLTLRNVLPKLVSDIMIICADGLTGIKEAIASAFPKTDYQRCIVHMVRNTLKHVYYKDMKAFAADLKTIYLADSEKSGRAALDKVNEKWSEKYPHAMKRWYDNWDAICPIFKFSMDTRKIIYTTNAIESVNSAYKKLNRQRSVFPSPTALMKSLYLSTMQVTKKWTQPLRKWGSVCYSR